ncbi:MAG TPA: hypothetical protein VMH41_12990 [Mycobacteriales bacterium]|nr:hypothetical protein [Mycobacteriales bacterium]
MAGSTWSPGLHALAAHLWGQPERVLVTDDAATDPDYRELESYLVVPSVAQARFLVPLTAGRATAAATLLAYIKLRSPAVRRRRRLVALGVRNRPLSARTGDRLRVLIRRDCDEDLRNLTAIRHLGEVLGRTDLVAAIGVPPATPNSKPTLQLFEPTGKPFAYAKLGWNDSTDRQVANEARMTARYASVLTRLQIPPLLAETTWRDHPVAITQAMARDATAWGHAPPPHLDVTRELAGCSHEPARNLVDLPVITDLAKRIEGEPCEVPGLLEAIREVLIDLTDRWGTITIRQGAWHGDWVPWNLAHGNGTTIAWDWEHAAHAAPIGFDLLHWHFDRAFVEGANPVPTSFAIATREGAAAVTELQDAAPDGSRVADPCAVLYLLERTRRHLDMADAGAGWNPRYAEGIVAALTGARELIQRS